MKKHVLIGIRVSKKQYASLEKIAQSKGFSTIAGYFKSELVPQESVRIKLQNDFRNQKIERHSFACYAQEWESILKKCGKIKSASQFIREAITAKLNETS